MKLFDRLTQLSMRNKYSASEYSLIRIKGERDIDRTTQLYSRGFGEKFIDEEYKHFSRNRESTVANFGIAYIDVDNFKMINDKYLDATGDEILRIIGSAIKENIRSEDVGIRWGGDELIIVLRGGSSDKLHNIFFGDGKPDSHGRNIYDGINHSIGEMVQKGIREGRLPNDFVWPLESNQVRDGNYLSAGFVCADETSSMRSLIDKSTGAVKANKKLRKAGR